MSRELKIFGAMAGVFLAAFYLPLSNPRVQNAILEAFRMLQWYARNHTLACVVPAMFIAGAITTFLSRQAVLRHLGPRASKAEAYSVASVSGTVLAVCSCSVLPMFAGIYKVGAGLGPASAFLYSGPALNVMAIFLTARVLGLQLGLTRAIAAIVFGVVIGLLMQLFFHRSEQARHKQTTATMAEVEEDRPERPLTRTVLLFTAMIGFLVFSDWFNPGNVSITLSAQSQPLAAVLLQETSDDIQVQVEEPLGAWKKGDRVTLPKSDILEIREADTWVIWLHHQRWYFAGAMGLLVLLMSYSWLSGEEVREWMANTWDFSKQIVPLLFGGVFLTGFVGALLPDDGVAALVGDNGLLSNMVASVLGAFMYFATLTEIPVTQALMEHGMAQGPALALLLAGPALSLPSILVMRSVWGWKKTVTFVSLTVVMAAIMGVVYGSVTAG